MDKKAFISTLHRLMNISADNETSPFTTTNKLLVLITAAGQIVGTPLQLSDKSQASDNASPKKSASDTIFSTVSDCFTDLGESSFVLMTDAFLETSGHKIAYPYLYVFTDDIIAVTVANDYPD